MSVTKLRLRRRLVESAGPIATFVCDRADAQCADLLEWIDMVTTQLDLDTLRTELLEIARPSLPAPSGGLRPEATQTVPPPATTVRNDDFEHLLALARARLERYTDAVTARKACEQARAQQLTDRRSLYRHLARYLNQPDERVRFMRLYAS